MVVKKHILENLNNLDNLYKKSVGAKEPLYYSKLAILELCGWIEISMDDIVRQCAKKNLRNPSNKKYIEDEFINKTHSFGYSTHFRRMLIGVIGLNFVEKLEQKVDSYKFGRLRAILGSLKKDRDIEAHEYIKGTTKILDAPSVTKINLPCVYDGLKEFEKALKKLKL